MKCKNIKLKKSIYLIKNYKAAITFRVIEYLDEENDL